MYQKRTQNLIQKYFSNIGQNLRPISRTFGIANSNGFSKKSKRLISTSYVLMLIAILLWISLEKAKKVVKEKKSLKATNSGYTRKKAEEGTLVTLILFTILIENPNRFNHLGLIEGETVKPKEKPMIHWWEFPSTLFTSIAITPFLILLPRSRKLKFCKTFLSFVFWLFIQSKCSSFFLYRTYYLNLPFWLCRVVILHSWQPIVLL